MKFLLPVIIVVLIVAAGYFVANQKTIPLGKSPSPSPMSQELKTFKSKIMKFTISVPSSFQVREEATFVDLEDKGAKINIGKNSTNSNDVNDYVKDFDEKRIGLEVEDQEALKIATLDVIKRIEKFIAGPIREQKIYYIYTENKVYSISTTAESLYDDLDQIAQSFRYIP